MPNIRTYDDIRAVFQTALEHGLPMRYTLPTPADAVRWRQRAYKFRQLTVISEFKLIVMRILPSDKRSVIIDAETAGVLTDLEGNIIPVNYDSDDSLAAEEAEVAALRKELKLDK